MHKYLDKSNGDFYYDQALNFYVHHAVQVPSSEPASSEVDSSVDDALAYHQYVLNSDNLRDSFENFQAHIIILEMLKILVTSGQLKGKMRCGYIRMEGDNTQTLPYVPSAQLPPNDSLVSISSATPDDNTTTPITTRF